MGKLISKKRNPTKEVYRGLREAFEDKNGTTYYIENLYVFGWESDVLVKTITGHWYEFEVKVSVQDFRADMKKPKHHILQSSNLFRPNLFTYAVHEDIAQKILLEVPSYAGLLSVSKYGFIKVLKETPTLHLNTYSDDTLGLCRKFYFNYKNYRRKYEEESAKIIADLKMKLSVVESEFEAINGYSIYDSL